jgi:hypothetical protein
MTKREDAFTNVARKAAEAAIERALTCNLLLPEYLDTRQAAAYLGMSKQQLELWRCKGGGPSYVKLAHAVRYRRSDLDAFMGDRLVSSTSEWDERKRNKGSGSSPESVRVSRGGGAQ